MTEKLNKKKYTKNNKTINQIFKEQKIKTQNQKKFFKNI